MNNSNQENGFPKLVLSDTSSNGMSVSAIAPKSFNCVEYTTAENKLQWVLISPWQQFEPADMAEWRQKIAQETVRRANNYDRLIEEIKSLQGQVTSWKDAWDKSQERIQQHGIMFQSMVETNEKTGTSVTKFEKGTDVTNLLLYKGSAK